MHEAPWLGRRSTHPSASMRCSASRIGCLLTPSCRARSVSTMCWPGGSSPPTIRSISASYTDWRSGTGRCNGRIIATVIVSPYEISP